MNLKQAFRYQNFLLGLFDDANLYLAKPSALISTTRVHHKSEANPEATDVTEVVEEDGIFYNPDDVVSLMVILSNERLQLTDAIEKAKANLDVRINAEIEANKFRRSTADRIDKILRTKTTRRIERGNDYKFNVEGNQAPYFYNVEVFTEELFDRSKMKQTLFSLKDKADLSSAEIDLAMVNTEVEYTAPYDVNSSFDDVMEQEFPQTVE